MKIFSILFGIAIAAAAGAALFAWSGRYDVSATEQHLPPTYWLLEYGMRRSVERRGERIVVPALGAPEQLSRGLALYRSHCLGCHGAPGVAPAAFALGLMPAPVPLAQTAREWPPGQIFWVVKYGIKMTGMPAWKYRMSDDDLWALVAFVQHLPLVSPAEYRALAAPAVGRREREATAADAERGRKALHQYACATCHRIPGVTGAQARVGPPLEGIASRLILGGVLPNSPENMVRWIRAPQEAAPLTAMPDLGVSERDARDMAAYLATLR